MQTFVLARFEPSLVFVSQVAAQALVQLLHTSVHALFLAASVKAWAGELLGYFQKSSNDTCGEKGVYIAMSLCAFIPSFVYYVCVCVCCRMNYHNGVPPVKTKVCTI